MIPVHREYTVEIYTSIDRGETVNLDNCYVEKFSLRDYRLTRNLETREKVHLKGFTAKNALFGGASNLDFSNAVIEGDVFSIEGSWISRGDVIFDECSMDAGKFSFKRAKFGFGDIIFEQVVFDNVDVSFERTIFGGCKVSFYNSWFNSLSLKFCHLNAYLDLRVRKSLSIDLTNTVVRDIIDINPHEFRSRIETIGLAGMRLMGRIYIDWTTSGVKQLIHTQSGSSHLVKAEQFRILKENFQNLGHYSDEDRAYVEFKRNESKAELAESIHKNKWNGFYQYPLYWFKLMLFDRAGLYATSPVRVLITMFILFGLFSVAYILLIAFTDADIVSTVNDQLGVGARSFYHSAITFLTIGYGDHYPYGSIRWVSSMEGFFGLFLMSYFTVAFVRKVLR